MGEEITQASRQQSAWADNSCQLFCMLSSIEEASAKQPHVQSAWGPPLAQREICLDEAALAFSTQPTFRAVGKVPI